MFSPRTLTLWPLLSSVLALVLSLLVGRLSPLISGTSLVAGFLLAGKLARGFGGEGDPWTWRSPHSRDHHLVEYAIILCVAWIAFKNFTWLLYPYDHDWRTLSKTNLGDLPMHLHFIRAFAGGLHFPPINPLYASEPLRYGFGPDLFNALFESLGMPTQGHLWIAGMMATATSLVALRAYGGWWAMAGFFFSGGLLHWRIVGAGLADETLAWRNLFETVFLTQRGLMFALPMGLLVLDGAERMCRGETPMTRRRVIFLGAIFGLIPFFHPHTFLALGLMLGLLLVRHSKGVRPFVLPLVISALSTSAYFLWQTTSGGAKVSIIRWHAHWTYKSGSVAWYYFANFGPWLLLVLAVGVFIVRRREERATFLLPYVSNLFLVLVFLNVMFAPWEWDNIKCLIWPVIGLFSVGFRTLDRALGSRTRWMLASILCFSGFRQVSLLSRTPPAEGHRLYTFEDIAKAEAATESLLRLPREQVRVVAAPSYAHVLTYLGLPRVAGYHGHLWSHAIVGSEETTRRIDSLYRGDPNWRATLKQLGATHLYLGPDERRVFGETNPEWRTALRNTSRIPGHEVYEIGESSASVQP